MHSSISSSEFQTSASLIKAWLLGICLAAAALTVWELAWRQLGHVPSVPDDKLLWCSQRRLVYASNAVVLLGTSRMHVGFSKEIFRALHRDRPLIQLAIEGHGPIATLRDLASDNKFSGKVLCEVFTDALLPAAVNAQQPWVDAFHQQLTLEKRLGKDLQVFLQSHLVFLDWHLNPKRVLSEWMRSHHLPRPFYIRGFPDRFMEADFSAGDSSQRLFAFDPAKGRAAYTDDPLTQAEWITHVKSLEPFVTAIRKRGGSVVFVVFPISGQVRKIEEEFRPKSLFWDPIRTETFIRLEHYSELPGIAQLSCPDGSHLDKRDARVFTAALLSDLHVSRQLPILSR